MGEKKTEKRPTVLLMAVGRCIMSDGKSEGRRFYEITEDELDTGTPPDDKVPDDVEDKYRAAHAMALVEDPWYARMRVYGGKGVGKNMGGSPGMVYCVEVDPEDASTIYSGTAQYVGQWPDREQRATWQMLDSTMGQKIALMRKAKKAKNQDDVLECLEPIREAYRKARGMQRNLILARAVQYITRG